MVDPAQPQDSWFFQDDDTREAASEPRSPRQEGSAPGRTPLPESGEEPPTPPAPASLTDDLSLEGTFLAGDQVLPEDPQSEDSQPFDEGSWLLDAEAEEPAPLHEDASQQGAREAGPVESASAPVEIAFEPWLDEGAAPAEVGALDEDARPLVLEGSWAESGVPRPNLSIRPFRWLGLGGAAAALAFAAFQLQGAFEAEQSVRPLAPEASIEFGVRLEGPGPAGAETAAAGAGTRGSRPA